LSSISVLTNKFTVYPVLLLFHF